MHRLLFLSIFTIIAGCASQPKPVFSPPPPKCINIPNEGCKKISAGNVGGTTLGYHDEIEDLPAKASQP